MLICMMYAYTCTHAYLLTCQRSGAALLFDIYACGSVVAKGMIAMSSARVARVAIQQRTQICALHAE
jgi:hypothetical protein